MSTFILCLKLFFNFARVFSSVRNDYTYINKRPKITVNILQNVSILNQEGGLYIIIMYLANVLVYLGYILFVLLLYSTHIVVLFTVSMQASMTLDTASTKLVGLWSYLVIAPW